MPNRIVDVVDALNAGVASGEDFFVTVMDDGGGTGTFARDNWETSPLGFWWRAFKAASTDGYPTVARSDSGSVPAV
jgi:hypothetical protein